MANNKLLYILLGLLVVLGFYACNTRNRFVGLDQGVNNAWAKVQSAYQRRADLIPNLVETVKGVADFEQTTLQNVVEARAKATSMTIDPSKITPDQLREFQAAQSSLGGALGRLLAVAENYPQLKANQNFLELQSQLEGTENRIKVERDGYNNTVMGYNTAVKRWPAGFFAGMFGFHDRPFFEAEKGAENAPDVKFDFKKQ